jgi:hypothetical protein
MLSYFCSDVVVHWCCLIFVHIHILITAWDRLLENKIKKVSGEKTLHLTETNKKRLSLSSLFVIKLLLSSDPSPIFLLFVFAPSLCCILLARPITFRLFIHHSRACFLSTVNVLRLFIHVGWRSPLGAACIQSFLRVPAHWDWQT